MDKRNVANGAFALPGLAQQGKKPFGGKFSPNKTRDTARVYASSTPKGGKDFAGLDDSSSLIDEQGRFLSPSSDFSLEHLTKSRPRSQGRRTPSPYARRKSWREDEEDSLPKSDAEPIFVRERGKDRERVPWDNKKEPDDLLESSKSKQKFSKRFGSDLSDGQGLGDLPPPLPPAPPPPEFGEGFEESSGQAIFTAGKLPETKLSSMSTKMDYHRPEVISKACSELNQSTLGKQDEITQERTTSDPKRPKISGDSNMNKLVMPMTRTTPALSLGSRENSSTFRVVDHSRGPVELEKSSSTRRRRFKPVTLPDGSESGSGAAESADENLTRSCSRSKNLFDSWLETSWERAPTTNRVSSSLRTDQHFVSASKSKSTDPQIVWDGGRKGSSEGLKKRDGHGYSTGKAETNFTVDSGHGGRIRGGKSDAPDMGRNDPSRHQLDSVDVRILPEAHHNIVSRNPPTFTRSDSPHEQGYDDSVDFPERGKQNGISVGFSHRIAQSGTEKKQRKAPAGVEGSEELQGDNGIVLEVGDLQQYDNGGEEIG